VAEAGARAFTLQGLPFQKPSRRCVRCCVPRPGQTDTLFIEITTSGQGQKDGAEGSPGSLNTNPRLFELCVEVLLTALLQWSQSPHTYAQSGTRYSGQSKLPLRQQIAASVAAGEGMVTPVWLTVSIPPSMGGGSVQGMRQAILAKIDALVNIGSAPKMAHLRQKHGRWPTQKENREYIRDI